MAAFMTMEARDASLSDPFKGESETQGFVGWIELTSFKLGYQGSLYNTGAPSGRSVYEPIQIKKFADRTTPAFSSDAGKNTQFKTVKVRITTSVNKETRTYLEYEFANVRILKYAIEVDAQVRAMESIFLAYTSILTKYHIIDKNGVAKGTLETEVYFQDPEPKN
jgi:type VI secretion system Hcp family effector